MAKLEDFLQGDYVAACLVGYRLTPGELASYQSLFNHAARALVEYGASTRQRAHAIWIPGRIELLGKHVDYAGGRSLVAALQKGFAFLVLESDKAGIEVIDGKSSQHVRMNPVTNWSKGRHAWSVYVKTVLNRIQNNFSLPPKGARICFVSNIPASAGMSSSSALVTGLFLAFNKIYGLSESEQYVANISNTFDLADYLGHVENGATYRKLPGKRGVGTMGGSQDHTAILCSRKNYFRLFSYKPVELVTEIARPENFTLCIACSGVRAEKTRRARSLYNSCSSLVQDVLKCASKNLGQFPTLEALIQSTDVNLMQIREMLRKCDSSEALFERVYQYYHETREVIPGAVKALQEGNYTLFGDLTAQSQYLADRFLKNQIEETAFLARSAQLEGAIASSAFGAGFGGSVWALVEKDSSELFLAAWKHMYEQAFRPRQEFAPFFVDGTGPPAMFLEA